MFYFLKSNFKISKYLSNVLTIIFFICFSFACIANSKNSNIDDVYKLLQEKKFEEGIKKLQFLSKNNDINAQLLLSKIFFSGDITPQDFENSYLWATSSSLGGLKKSKIIVEKLNNYLSDKQIKSIKEKVRSFLEKRALKKDKRAIIQIAKFYEQLIDPPDMINSYTWYNIAVASGIKSAKNKRDEILNELNEKDLLEAQALAIKMFKDIK